VDRPDGSDGWSAQFDMTRATNADDLVVVARGTEGSSPQFTLPVNLIDQPAWLLSSNTTYAHVSVTPTDGYTFEGIRLADVHEGFATRTAMIGDYAILRPTSPFSTSAIGLQEWTHRHGSTSPPARMARLHVEISISASKPTCSVLRSSANNGAFRALPQLKRRIVSRFPRAYRDRLRVAEA